MIASQFIAELTKLIAEFGDQTIINEYGQEIDTPEYNDDNGECFLVSFSEVD
jgi:hypothetical protein